MRRLMLALSSALAAVVALAGCVTVSSGTSFVDVDQESVLLPRVSEVVLPTAPARAPRPDPARVVELPGGIDTSGETNVSRRLQRFIDGVPDDSLIRFPQGATFRLDRAISLEGRSGLVFDGAGSELRIDGCTVEDSGFLIGRAEPSSDITLRGFEIVGENDRAGTVDAYLELCEFQMGVAIYQSSGIRIEDVSVRRVNGDCLYVAGGGDTESWSRTITFQDSTCVDTGRMGVAIIGGEDVLVEEVEFDRIALFPFDIEPNREGDGASDIFFVHNIVGSYTESDTLEPYVLKTNGAGEEGSRVSGVLFAFNTVTGGPLLISAVDENRSDVVVAGNESPISAAGPIMKFENVDGLTVFGNEQPLESGPLIIVRASDGVLIQ